jgi:peptidoglycan hydrolase CwlO-like protein
MKKETLTKILAAAAASFILSTAVFTTAAATSLGSSVVSSTQTQSSSALDLTDIFTDRDLEQLMETLSEKMTALSRERDELRLVVKRVQPEATITKAKEDIRSLTSEIKELRHELKVCRDVQERSEHVRENLDIIDRDRTKERERS